MSEVVERLSLFQNDGNGARFTIFEICSTMFIAYAYYGNNEAFAKSINWSFKLVRTSNSR